MVRKIEVTVPNNLRSQIESVLKGHRSVHHLVIIPCVNNVIFQFKVVNKKADELIEKLTSYGVATSSKRGSIDVHALRTSKPRVTTYRGDGSKRKKAYSYYDRLPFDEIEESVDGQLHLTFDYLALIVVGAMIGGVGLLTNSSVSVVASMLVSPLMGPILGMTFGYVIDKPDMYRKAFRNEVVGVLVCFVTGGILGFISAPFVDPITNTNLAFGSNTQMSSRGDPTQLIWGALIAIPSGMGVALGVSSDQVSALIGVAISAALLPPITNSGLALCIGIVLYIQDENWDYVNEYIQVGGVSMILFIMNWFLIFVFGIGTFKLKKVEKTHSKLQNLQKYNEMISMPEESGTTNKSGNTLTPSYGQPLLPSEYGSTSVVIGISDDKTADANVSNSPMPSTSGGNSTTLKNSKHKKSTTDFMVDNQAMQGDNVFDLIDNAGKSRQQLKKIMESNGTMLERRLSDGVVGSSSDWNSSVKGIANSKSNMNPNSADTRLRHGSVGRHDMT